MRIIDADALKEDLKDPPLHLCLGGMSMRDVLQLVDYAPTIDAVQVVRCKKCKYGKVDDSDFPTQYLCEYRGSDWNNGDHFCSYGERKDDED